MTESPEKIHVYFVYHKTTKEFCGSFETYPVLKRFVGFQWFKRYKLNPDDYDVLGNNDEVLPDYLAEKVGW